ncbi:MAG: acyl-CoA dehydrogenase family protein, partial [Mycobacteriales bacterium]
MDLAETPTARKWRADVRSWLAANVPRPALPSMDTAEGSVSHRAWERQLHDARLAVVTWPEELGGRGADLMDWLIFEEEYWAAGAPGRVGQNGIFLLAPALFEYGNEEQRLRFLPPMASADEVWAQAWSEPDAGSDLAALRSRAVPVPGGWRVSGTKTWSSRATFADWCFGLFRTDPDSQRHRGLSYLLIPLTAEGVTVRPIRQLDGESGFAEIFFDYVFVPDGNVLGQVGEGWQVAMSTTTSERGLTLRSPGRFLASADQLADLWRQVASGSDPALDPALRGSVARAWMAADAYRLYVLRTVAKVQSGEPVGAESSANKVFWSELDIRLH